MRLFFWGLVAIGAAYCAYAVMMSAWQYFQVSGVVDNLLYTVKIIWPFPVIIYQGEPVLSIPLSLTRTKQTAGAFYLPAGRAFASVIIRSTRVRSSPAGTTLMKCSHERIAPAASFFAS